MKIMIDMNLSPSWVPLLESNGYTTTHWSQTGSASAPDSEIMEWVRKHGYVVFTHDLDYGSLLFVTQAIAPSVIQLRSEDVRPSTAGPIVLEALRKAEKAIAQGALVIIDPRKNRIRLLPLKKNNP
jgi:predicted nuclease of predicted toxin-antitoxin system